MSDYNKLIKYTLNTYAGVLKAVPEEEWAVIAGKMVDSIEPPTDYQDVFINQMLFESAKFLRAHFDEVYKNDAVG